MAYTVLQLLTNAYYDSGIVARDFETITGSQYNDGLSFLNDILEEKRLDDGALPYYKDFDLTFETGVEKYFIENLIEIDTIVFYLNSVRYSMANQKRRQFFGSPRAENIETLPTNWHMERTLGGSDVYIYFLPDQDYPVKVWGLFALDQVALNDDLSTMFDRYYITYLRYDLAITLCQEFNFEIPAGIQQKFMKYDKLIRKRSGVLDLQNTVISTLGGQSSLNYAQVNLGKGWAVSNWR